MRQVEHMEITEGPQESQKDLKVKRETKIQLFERNARE
jgi:hypothetical protein